MGNQIAALTEQLEAAEQRLSRLVTREMMSEVCAEIEEPQPTPGEVSTGDTEPVASEPVSVGLSQIGLMLVPQRTPAMAVAVLPEDYGEIMAVLAESGDGMRAGQVAVELGIDRVDRSKVESLRSKLKRLVARGWLDQQPSGQFTIAE
ncbi:hypothetical protein [Nocardia sp. NPDC005366]|uniref:hypothetical protein n=1 Tax=Nocardia sp. NPDC005366 TaxID=3156878 RepID=UPI0033A30E48